MALAVREKLETFLLLSYMITILRVSLECVYKFIQLFFYIKNIKIIRNNKNLHSKNLQGSNKPIVHTYHMVKTSHFVLIISFHIYHRRGEDLIRLIGKRGFVGCSHFADRRNGIKINRRNNILEIEIMIKRFMSYDGTSRQLILSA